MNSCIQAIPANDLAVATKCHNPKQAWNLLHTASIKHRAEGFYNTTRSTAFKDTYNSGMISDSQSGGHQGFGSSHRSS